MTPAEYHAFADHLARTAGVENGLHGYFLQHRDRLWRTASHFDLWNLRGQSILEIGPFFSYTPFALRKQGNDVQVFEGDDPAVLPLKPLYEKAGIGLTIGDLFDSFGAAAIAKHRLPYDDHRFDVVSCWETMEHFNFNPTGFVRDLHRVLKPGGKAFVTVPNMAELENRVKLLRGRSIGTEVENYSSMYNYGDGRFLGFHWREYVLREVEFLFRAEKFSIVSARHLLTFQNAPHLSLPRRLKRLAAKLAFAALPSTGNLCAVIAQK